MQRREADIAIRHVKPEQPDLIARFVRELTAHFYASESWVKVHGHPRTASDAANVAYIGADRNGQYLGMLQQQGLPVTEANVSCYAYHSVVQWSLAREGFGVAAMVDDVALATPGMMRVFDDITPFRFPIWLVSHRELRTSRSIRVVFEALADGLASINEVSPE